MAAKETNVGIHQIRKMGPNQKKILLSQSESKKKYFKLSKFPREQIIYSGMTDSLVNPQALIQQPNLNRVPSDNNYQ